MNPSSSNEGLGFLVFMLTGLQDLQDLQDQSC